MMGERRELLLAGIPETIEEWVKHSKIAVDIV
jgi:hypothetical protein